MNFILNSILTTPAWLMLGIVGLTVFSEDALFLGFVLPGETVAIVAGVAAHLGHVPLWGVLLTVITAAIVGDTVGYEIGRHFGPRLLDLPMLKKRRRRLDDARDLLARRGGMAVFLGRWIAFFRAVMPGLAGIVRMPYFKFLAYNATGGIAWGSVVVLIGYAVGASYTTVQSTLGTATALGAAALVCVGLIVWRIRKQRATHSAPVAVDRS